MFRVALMQKKSPIPSTYIYSTPLDFGYAQGIGEDYARKNGRIFSDKTAKWRKAPPTEKQLEWLKKFNIPYENLTKGDASDALDNYFAQRAIKKIQSTK